MSQKDKFLLLQDLCARLPYHCRVFYEYVDDLDGKTYGYGLTLNTWCINEFNADKAVVKPYLRPVLSMTEEEKAELKAITDEFGDNWLEATTPEEKWKCTFLNSSNEIDWLNAHHFDYRGLIEKGLALEAPEGMYEY